MPVFGRFSAKLPRLLPCGRHLLVWAVSAVTPVRAMAAGDEKQAGDKLIPSPSISPNGPNSGSYTSSSSELQLSRSSHGYLEKVIR